MKKLFLLKGLLVILMSVFTIGGMAQNSKKVLLPIFDVGEVSTLQPSNNGKVLVIPAFLSVRRNQIQMLDVEHQQIDMSVLFVLEHVAGNSLRWFIINAETKKVLSCASLSGMSVQNNGDNTIYTFSALYDNLLGHQNWNSMLSLMARQNETLNLNAVSIIMGLDNNLVLELVGVIGNDSTLADIVGK